MKEEKLNELANENLEEGCGCGHDHNHNHEEEALDTILLTLDDNTELECGVLGIFEVPSESRDYIALVSDEDEQILLYRYIEDSTDEESFTLESIETDDEFDKVSEVFHQLFMVDDEEE